MIGQPQKTKLTHNKQDVCIAVLSMLDIENVLMEVEESYLGSSMITKAFLVRRAFIKKAVITSTPELIFPDDESMKELSFDQYMALYDAVIKYNPSCSLESTLATDTEEVKKN